jgi:superoxide reductase
MKRRDFLTVAAGAGAGAALAGQATSVEAADKAPAEKRSQIYRCEECGAMVEVLEAGTPPLVHCGKPMILLPEITEGEGAAKHVPVIEKIAGGYKVKVGATAHPMGKPHHIAWIDLLADGKTYRAFLELDKPAEAVFLIDAEKVSARAYCNLHGLWKSV